MRFSLKLLPSPTAGRIRRIRRSANATALLMALVRVSTGAVLGTGVGLLGVKTVCEMQHLGAACCLGAGIGLVVSFLILRARHGFARLSDSDAAVLYGLSVNDGELGLSLAAVPSKAWVDQLPDRHARPLRTKWSQAVRPLILPGIFLGAVLLVPVYSPKSSRRHLAMRRAVSRSEKTAEMLAEADLLTENELEELRKDLATIEKSQDPSSPQAWEALDAIDEALSERTQSAADALAWTMEALDALKADPDGEASRSELSAALDRLAKTGAMGKLPGDLSKALSSRAGKMGLPKDPNELKALMDRLDKRLGDCAKQMLANCNPADLAKAAQALRDLAEFTDARLVRLSGG